MPNCLVLELVNQSHYKVPVHLHSYQQASIATYMLVPRTSLWNQHLCPNPIDKEIVIICLNRYNLIRF